jgi:deoxyribonuclease-4
MKILLGPAGTPAKSTIDGLKVVKELGLQAMEVEFVHGIGMGIALAKQIGEENKKFNIKLSVHAPYFINLCSEEKAKIFASKKRILDSCERGHHMGAEFIVFHPGFYGSRTKSDTYDMIRNEIDEMNEVIKKNKWDVKLAPETTGKGTQFGDIDETVSMAKDTKCSLCLDPAHIFARNNGKIDYDEVLYKIKTLKREHLHCHFSGIAYTIKGERNHVVLGDKPNFKEFAETLMKKKMNCTVICESPITWKDSLKMKGILQKMGYKF